MLLDIACSRPVLVLGPSQNFIIFKNNCLPDREELGSFLTSQPIVVGGIIAFFCVLSVCEIFTHGKFWCF